MNTKIKNKNVILFGLFLTIFFFAGVSGVNAATYVSCSPDGSASGQACSVPANGNHGICNGAGICVDAKSGPICNGNGKTSGQACVVNGNYGICNGADVCVDAKSGPIPISNTKSATPGTTANNSAATGVGTNFTNPLTFKTVEEFLGGIMSAIQKIIVVLALVFIVIGAVMILVSAGSSDMVERGKKAITMALVGFAIGVAAPSLLKELAGLIGYGGDTSAVAGALTLSAIAINVLNFLLGTMGILALVMMVIGAIMYLTSAGDEDRIDKGKDIFKYALIGVVMAMISMILVTQIAKFFSTNSTATTATSATIDPSGL